MIQSVASGTPLYATSPRRRGIQVQSSPGGGGGGFSPATMTGIQGWYDFSTLALTDGTAIASLSDGSANGRTLTATGTAQPLCKTGANGINGLPVALFDGVNDVMTTAAFAVSQPITVYAVVSHPTTGTGGRYWSSADASLSMRVGYDFGVGPNCFAGSTVSGTDATGGPGQLTTVFNGASSLIRLNGVQNVTGNPGVGTLSNGLAIGAALSAQFYTGRLGELFWTNVATVDTAAEAYMKTKWGTP